MTQEKKQVLYRRDRLLSEYHTQTPFDLIDFMYSTIIKLSPLHQVGSFAGCYQGYIS